MLRYVDWCYLVYIFLLCNVLGNSSIIEPYCYTPDKTLGTCMPTTSCRFWYKSTSLKDFNKFQQMQCGMFNEKPNVCCTLTNDNKKLPPLLKNAEHLPAIEQCGQSLGSKIVGGGETGLDEFQWMALLKYKKPTEDGFHCGGSLISNRYVLTAAHCLLSIPSTWKLISVRLGEHNLDTDIDCQEYCAPDPPLDILIEKQIVHEKFDLGNSNFHHDIALLRLQQSVIFTDFIIPICLPPVYYTDYLGLNMTVAGWGRTENGVPSAKKLKLDVPVQSHWDCSITYKSSYAISLIGSQMCAGGVQGEDSCRGDSGGPLMHLYNTKTGPLYYVAGIVSFGPKKCGSKNIPGIYTKVSDYIPWIISKLSP